VIAKYFLDTSASARMTNPEVAAILVPLVEGGVVGTCASLDAEALFSARNPREYEEIRDNRRQAYEYLPTDDRHWRAAFDVQRDLARSGRHRAVGIADLLTAVLAAEQSLTIVHYDADFEIVREVLRFRHRWVAPRGSL